MADGKEGYYCGGGGLRRNWIKLYVDQSLRGTMISELSAEERWVWIGLLLMAGDSNVEGKVFLRKDKDGNLVGYSEKTLAELLAVDALVLKYAKKKLKKYSKVSINRKKVITILNWHKYQSEYSRQKSYRESYKKSCNLKCNQSNTLELDKELDIDIIKDEVSKDTSALNDKNRSELTAKKVDKILKEKKEKKEKLEKEDKITFSFEERIWLNIQNRDLILWKTTYPACNIKSELNRMADWLLSNPKKRKKNYRRFISNWLSRTQDKGGSSVKIEDELNAWAEKMTKKDKKDD